VRHGELAKIPPRLDNKTRTSTTQHTVANVYTEMLRQIVRDYGSLPDPRSMTFAEIEFWYQGLVPELMRGTAP
jgi:hypothetical protein